MNEDRDETEQMRVVALRNANSVLMARQRAQQELVDAKEALRRANQQMEAMLESLTDGFCSVDRQWCITYLNSRALELFGEQGRQRETLLGKPVWEAFPELQGSVLDEQWRHALEVQQTVSFEFFYPKLARWYDVRVYPAAEGLTTYFQDITQRKKDQQAVLDVNNRLQVALSAGRLGDWRWDASTDRVTLGARAAEIFALPA